MDNYRLFRYTFGRSYTHHLLGYFTLKTYIINTLEYKFKTNNLLEKDQVRWIAEPNLISAGVNQRYFLIYFYNIVDTLRESMEHSLTGPLTTQGKDSCLHFYSTILHIFMSVFEMPDWLFPPCNWQKQREFKPSYWFHFHWDAINWQKGLIGILHIYVIYIYILWKRSEKGTGALSYISNIEGRDTSFRQYLRK